jgi:hypothetical protein
MMKHFKIFFVLFLFFTNGRGLQAENFGEIAIQEIPMTFTNNQTQHGYIEYRFRVINKDAKAHRVGLEMPSQQFAGSAMALRRITNSIEVPPKSTAILRLLQPPVQLSIGVNQAQAIIDGRYQRNLVTYREIHFEYNAGRHPADKNANVLTSNNVSGNFRAKLQREVETEIAEIERTRTGASETEKEEGTGKSENQENKPDDGGVTPAAEEEKAVPEVRASKIVPMTAPVSVPLPPLQELVLWQSSVPVEEWSDHWLAYSRFDAVVIADSEWNELSEKHTKVHDALRKYTETGGILAVVGTHWSIPKEWVKNEKISNQYQAVLGFAYVFPKDIDKIDPYDKGQFVETLRIIGTFRNHALEYAKLWNDVLGVSSSGRHGVASAPSALSSDSILLHALPVVENYGVNVKLIMVLIVCFAVLIGPVNIYVLYLLKRRIWLIWTVPVTSLIASLLVFGASFLHEGLLRQASSATLTVIDQRREEAITFGYVGFYATLTPNAIQFSGGTEAVACMNRHYYGYGGTVKSLDFSIMPSGHQHLTHGWISARIPAYFAIRKAESQRKERVVFDWNAKPPAATNGLGVDIRSLHVRSPKGILYTANNIKAGQNAVLNANLVTPAAVTQENLAELSEKRQSWIQSHLRSSYFTSLPTGTINFSNDDDLPNCSYRAEIDVWNPFVENGIERTKPYQNKTVIVGFFE